MEQQRASLPGCTYRLYVTGVVLVGAWYFLLQTACIPPTDQHLTALLTENQRSYEALRDLLLEDNRASGIHWVRNDRDLRFHRTSDRAGDNRTARNLPLDRAARYRRLLAATHVEKIYVLNDDAVAFEVWGYGLPPDVWHFRGVVWGKADPATRWDGGGFTTTPLGGGWYLFEDWNS